jgi:hypothetical protein
MAAALAAIAAVASGVRLYHPPIGIVGSQNVQPTAAGAESCPAIESYWERILSLP